MSGDAVGCRVEIPEDQSALVLILGSQRGGDELMSAVAIDTNPIVPTPVGKGVRIDINALGGLPGSIGALFGLLGSLEPLFPGATHLVGVIEDAEKGRIIVLPKPSQTENSNGTSGHTPLPLF